MSKKRIAIGLSGGVDSSVSAYLLKKKGWEVIGFTLKFYPQENRCCDSESLSQAQRLCHNLGIPHYLLDVSDLFRKKIIDYFIQDYLKGHTPNPCARCNLFIKFGIFLERVKSLGIDYLATGHYVRLDKQGRSYFFRKAKDAQKSQEYFLTLVNPQVLKSLTFPLGGYTKLQVKRIAKEKKLMFKERKESQDACFVKDKFYPQFIEENISRPAEYHGEVRHIQGNLLGKHKGIYYYTYGQRSGLGIAYKYPLYVASIDGQSKTVFVGPRQSLYKDNFLVHSSNWFIQPQDKKIKVKVRYNSQEVPCVLKTAGQNLEVKLLEKLDAITPGQVAAFYQRDKLLGGGIISKA